MNLLKLFPVFLKEPRFYFRRWRRNLEIQLQNPGVELLFPIYWFFDDIQAIQMGTEIYIGSFSEIIVLKQSHSSRISGRLTIQDRVVIGSHANIRAAGGEIFIGRNSILAQQVSLIASGHEISLTQPYRDLKWDESKTGILIAENVWIGAGVTILPGCKIGANSVIGAGSVVTRNIPENEIWAGIPARKLRVISPETQQQEFSAQLDG